MNEKQAGTPIRRGVVGMLGFVPALYAVGATRTMVEWGLGFVPIVIVLSCVELALGAWLYAAMGDRAKVRQLLGRVFLAGLIGGAVGWALGFFGPLIYGVLAGDDNPQGPLVGFFLTGPIGFLVGSIVGLGITRRSAGA